MISLTVNGRTVRVAATGMSSVLHIMREKLGLRGSKAACEEGECGSCTILMDGEPVCACLVLAADADGAEITTIEALDGEIANRVREAFAAAGAVQCGYCTPGVVVSATILLARTPYPNDDQIREALVGHLCRCTGYGSMLRAMRLVVDADSNTRSGRERSGD